MRLREPGAVAVRLAVIAALGLLLMLPAGLPRAQQDDIAETGAVLVINAERLLEGTRLGQRLLSELQAEREKLIAENRRIEAELSEEERALTKKRGSMAADAFRELADEFDAKVQRIRAERDRAGRALERRGEVLPNRFMRMIEPVLAQLLDESGAAVMIERRAVLLARAAADVSDLAIARIDARFGDKGPDEPAGESGSAVPGNEPAPGDDGEAGEE